MSKRESEQPSQNLSLSELLNKLRNGELLGGGSGFGVINIDSQPNLRGDFSFGPGGFPEIGFGEKFEDGFQGWEFGTRIRTNFRVVKKDDERQKIFGLQVAESVVGDIRHSDTFFLNELTEDEEAALASVGMAEVEAVVEVRKRLHSEHQVSNMQEYSARIDRVINVQKPWDGNLEALQEEQAVLVEGEVVEYVQNREYPYDGAHLTIKMNNDQLVSVKLWNGYLSIEDGVIDNFSPNNPISGDVVQVNTTYGNPGARYGEDKETQFFAYFCRSTYLLKPESQRQRANENQREFVERKITEIDQAQSAQQVRHIVATIIDSSLAEGSGLNLTSEEKRRISSLVDERIKDDGEKPLVLFEDLWGTEDVRNGYGIDIYSVSRNEYYEFCLQVARGEKKMIADGSSDSPWRVMKGSLTRDQEKHVLTEAITHFYPLVVGKRTIRREEILVDPEDIPDIHEKEYGHRIGNKVVVGRKDYDPAELENPNNVTWDDQYRFDQTLNYLSSQIGADVSTLYIGLIRKMHDGDLFMKAGEDRLRNFCEFEIVNAMISNAQNNIVWKDGKWGTKIIDLKDTDAARVYLREPKLLQSLKAKLVKKGWNNDGRRRSEQHTEELVVVLQAIDVYLKQAHAHLN